MASDDGGMLCIFSGSPAKVSPDYSSGAVPVYCVWWQGQCPGLGHWRRRNELIEHGFVAKRCGSNDGGNRPCGSSVPKPRPSYAMRHRPRPQAAWRCAGTCELINPAVHLPSASLSINETVLRIHRRWHRSAPSDGGVVIRRMWCKWRHQQIAW